ncbi:MAG: phospholipase A, partial [Verrucomicrobiota bacterium]
MQRSFFSNCNARLGSLLTCFFFLLNVSAGDVTLTISELASEPHEAGSAGFWLNALNPSNEETSWKAPSEIKCRVTSQSGSIEVVAKPQGVSAPEAAVIAPGSFARREYTLPIPKEWNGDVALELSDLGNLQLLLKTSRGLPVPAVEPTRKGMVYFLKGRKFSEDGRYDPEIFFKEHFFGYEPFYFVAGTESPNAKFQISFKYRLLNDHGWLAEKAPLLSGFHVAYSQTSLWDWNAASAPFFDSSYRPEFLYSWDRIFGGEPTNWFQLDFQTGVQHESNGRSEPESRSLNIAYLRPRLTFGKDSGLQLTLT